jgi:pilus assembly protein CpaC
MMISKRWLLSGLVAVALATGPALAEAARSAKPAAASPAGALSLTISQGKLVTLPGAAASVFVADPAIANVQVPMPNKVFVFGIKAGRTTVYALAADGTQLASFLVVVHNDTTAVEQSLLATPDTGGVNATSTDTGVTLRGMLPNPEAAATAVNSAGAAIAEGQKVEDETHVKDSAQVMLQVRIAEVSRSITKDLGLNLNTAFTQGGFSIGAISGRQTFSNSTPQLFQIPTNGDYSLLSSFSGRYFSMQNVIDALAQEGLITVLAEPNLTTVSGQPASFIAGGEFPIPISQSSGTQTPTITVEFKQYGVSLDFVPTVYDSNHISLKVRPEVSEITDVGAVSLNGLTIPALTVRRADTTIELGSGESFAIGGLLQNSSNTTLSKYPGLGDLPVLGALFRSTNFQKNESELVIIVTPYIVHPIDDPRKLHIPTDALRPPSDIERLFMNRVTARPDVPPTDGVTGIPSLSAPRLVGDAGFDIQ